MSDVQQSRDAARIRHSAPPPPWGCRWCGVEKRDHAQLWVPSKRWHGWAEPTREQIHARLRARLTASERAR